MSSRTRGRRVTRLSCRHAVLPAPRPDPPQATYPIPRRRDLADRGGLRARRVLGERVDPLPPRLAVPDQGARRLRAVRARGVGPRRARPPALRHLRHRSGGRRGDLRPRGQRHARDDLRRPALQRRRLRRRAARDDLPLPARRGAALPRLRDAGPDHDPASLPQRPRPADGARAVLPPRHPPAGRAPHPPRARRVRRQGARPRRLPDLRARLPPLRRRRLGRLRLPVDVLDPRLRADHGADPHAAAEPPDLPGPELRDLLVLSAQARLRPERDPDPLPPLEPAVGGDDLLRLRKLRLAARDRRRLDHAPPVGPAARAAAGARGEVDRHDGDDGTRGHVRHLPAAEAVEARRRARRRALRLLLVRGDRAGARGEGRRRGSRRRDLSLLSFTPRQAEILDAAHAWAAVDPRVRALVLKGSFGRGEGDERSDLDLVIVAEPGRRDELWAERRAVAERLGRLLGLFRDVANWRPPNLAIATFDGPLKVDLFFEDDEVEPSRWLRDGFQVLVDKDEVEERVRAGLEELPPQVLDDLHEDLVELDSHAWDFALWLDRKLELGEPWIVRLGLPLFAELIVLPAWNALAGEGWRGPAGPPKRVEPALPERLDEALPCSNDPDELRRSLRALVALYVDARPRLVERLGQPLDDELMNQTRARVE